MTEKSKEKILEYIKNNHLDYDGVFGELVDASESSVDLLWRLALDFYSPLQTHTSIVMSKEEMIIHELFKQCKSFKKQRDELINDMADIKRKAEAFDEIVNAVDESANSYELVARIKLEVLKYQKLERGSDEEI